MQPWLSVQEPHECPVAPTKTNAQDQVMGSTWAASPELEHPAPYPHFGS